MIGLNLQKIIIFFKQAGQETLESLNAVGCFS